MPLDDDPRSALDKLIDGDPYGEIERPPCEECRGQGEVERPVGRDSFGNWDTMWTTCPACDGQG